MRTRSGARLNGGRGHLPIAFFKDQRAHQIGDLLTVQGAGQHHRQGYHRQRDAEQPRHEEDSGVDNFFGKNKAPIMNAAVPTRILSTDSMTTLDGKGSVNRSEALTTNVAAVVTQVSPNGNLVVEDRQEIRVNYESAN